MKIAALIENTSLSKNYHHQHGLSLYIESGRHKILFDTGSNGKFIENAERMQIDLQKVDTVIISHGHSDHGGGLKAFLEINQTAHIYMGAGAFDPHIFKILKLFNYNVGLDKTLQDSKRIHFVENLQQIDVGITLFSGVQGKVLSPKGNRNLYKQNSFNMYQPDDFEHEINLLITEGTKTHLICACAHKGIINIIDRATELANGPLHTVVGGFHLMGMSPRRSEDAEYLNQLTKALLEKNVGQYYTCHCTGEANFKYLAGQLNTLGKIQTGQTLTI